MTVGATFTAVERQWMAGIAAMAMAVAGAYVLIEDNFIGGPASQQRWPGALRGTTMGWIGVRCAPEVAAAREAARGDREIETGASTPAELTRVEQDHFWPTAH